MIYNCGRDNKNDVELILSQEFTKIIFGVSEINEQILTLLMKTYLVILSFINCLRVSAGKIDEKSKNFYRELPNIDDTSIYHDNVIMGDLNCRVGQE